MPEVFLLLLAGGVMLATAVCDPRQVTLVWLRLGGLIALGVTVVAGYFAAGDGSGAGGRVGMACAAIVGVLILAQLGLVQSGRARVGRVIAMAACCTAIVAGCVLMWGLLPSTKGRAIIYSAAAATCMGIASVTGLALMSMLLGHAYLTASKLTISPFLRMNRALAAAIGVRAVVAVGVTMLMASWLGIADLWKVEGLMILVRWLVGLAVPGVFVWMADDCIRRRATQSATGILYVTAVLVFAGELVGLYLATRTGLSF